MKICSISDLHGNIVKYPSNYWKGLDECEVLFICGDIIPLNIQTNMVASKTWLIHEFKSWALELPVEKIYFIPGNHDFWFERCRKEAKELFPLYDKVSLLDNEYTEYLSEDFIKYRIFGTPYCHQFGNWAFMRSEETLTQKFSIIPEDIDILISHDAPFGTSDVCYESLYNQHTHIGCPELRDAILEKNPKLCLHGHLHSSNHKEEILGNTKVYNTSILNEQYNITYPPLYLEI